MKDIYYHLINAGIAGGLVMLGSLSTIFTGNPTGKEIGVGFALGLITGTIIFLNKFQEWFKLQDKCKSQKILNFI